MSLARKQHKSSSPQVNRHNRQVKPSVQMQQEKAAVIGSKLAAQGVVKGVKAINNTFGANRLGKYLTAGVHETKSGDSYWKLSKQYGASVEDLRAWNKYSDRNIPTGVNLIISKPVFTIEGMIVFSDEIAHSAYDAKGRKNLLSNPDGTKYDFGSDMVNLVYDHPFMKKRFDFFTHGEVMEIVNLGQQQIRVLKRGSFLNFREDTYAANVQVSDPSKSVEQNAAAIVERNGKMFNDFALTMVIVEGAVTVFTLGEALMIRPFIPVPTRFTGPYRPVASYRTSGGQLNFASTPAKHMKNSSRYVPVQMQRATIGGKAYPDPGGSTAKAYYSRMYRNGKMYNLQVVYHRQSNTVYHFHYTKRALGPLKAI
jgi:LysM repeat protein